VRREHVSRVPAKRATEEAAAQETSKAAAQKAKLEAEMDELLAGIDGVLETNAQEFVNSYVQAGGE
jgi:prokaryotic ubiquitin-like protein Pup